MPHKPVQPQSVDGEQKMDKKAEYLHSKIQIGNCKGPITYKLKQTVFHHDDIPDDKRKRHGEIKNWLKSKILTEETPSWNKSSYVHYPECERRTMENHVHDRSNAFRYNFRSESLECLKNVEPIDKPTKMHISTQYESTAQDILDRKASSRFLSGNFNRTGEMPSHPNLADTDSWKVSTFVEPKQINQQLDDMTKRAQEWTSQVSNSEQMLKKRVSLIKQTKLIQEEVRKQKAEGIFSSTKLVHRPRTAPVDRKKLKNRFPNEKLNKQSNHQHSGVWEMNKLEGRYMWSDTGSTNYHSKGDIKKTVNLDAYNFEGPNLVNGRLPPINMHHKRHSPSTLPK